MEFLILAIVFTSDFQIPALYLVPSCVAKFSMLSFKLSHILITLILVASLMMSSFESPEDLFLFSSLSLSYHYYILLSAWVFFVVVVNIGSQILSINIFKDKLSIWVMPFSPKEECFCSWHLATRASLLL